MRQPVTIAVKVYSGRRPKRDLEPALFWIAVYGVFLIFSLGLLINQGYAYILWIAFPASIVFAWHLVLFSRRRERRQAGIEVVGSGVLSLAAPAAFWVSKGDLDPVGWWLFILIWLQSAASIVYIYLRLDQRDWETVPSKFERFKHARRALSYACFNFIFVLIFSLSKDIPQFLPIPYALQLLETICGSFRPAIGLKPTYLGFRQLAVSSIFTLLFVIFWNI
jgi:O-antigen/teichoic acid export membrane protein